MKVSQHFCGYQTENHISLIQSDWFSAALFDCLIFQLKKTNKTRKKNPRIGWFCCSLKQNENQMFVTQMLQRSSNDNWRVFFFLFCLRKVISTFYSLEGNLVISSTQVIRLICNSWEDQKQPPYLILLDAAVAVLSLVAAMFVLVRRGILMTLVHERIINLPRRFVFCCLISCFSRTIRHSSRKMFSKST